MLPHVLSTSLQGEPSTHHWCHSHPHLWSRSDGRSHLLGFQEGLGRSGWCCVGHWAWHCKPSICFPFTQSAWGIKTPRPKIISGLLLPPGRGASEGSESRRQAPNWVATGSIYLPLCPWRPLRARHSRVFVGRKKQSYSHFHARPWGRMLGAELQRCPDTQSNLRSRERKKLRQREARVAVIIRIQTTWRTDTDVGLSSGPQVPLHAPA